MTNKIAILKACAMSTSSHAPHIRYTLFERRIKTGKLDWDGDPVYDTTSNIVLRYEGKTIREILDGAKFEFGVHRGLIANTATPTEGDDFEVSISQQVSGIDHLRVQRIGSFGGYDCYVLFFTTMPKVSRLTYMSLKSMPEVGRASVVYDVDVARRSMERRNITNVLHDASSLEDRVALIDLFNYMHDQIVPIMQPFVDATPNDMEK